MMIYTQNISPEKTYSLRHSVLRPHQPLNECLFPGDDDPTNFHLGTFFDEKLVSIGSFYQESTPKLTCSIQYRLRGMATDPKFRGKGFGAQVIYSAYPLLNDRKCQALWFNAREVAFGFYEKLGF